MELAHAVPLARGTERIDLRPADRQDVDTLTQITAAAFDDPEEVVRQHVLRQISNPREQWYLARLAGTPVGALRVWDEAPDASIYAFGVAPEYRRRGIGRQMLSLIVERLRAEGRRRIGLEVLPENTAAVALYRSCGFEITTTYGYYAYPIT